MLCGAVSLYFLLERVSQQLSCDTNHETGILQGSLGERTPSFKMPPKSIMKATRKAKSKEKSRVASSEGERRPAISKGTGVDDSVECSVCCQAIVEGKDEALFCEGECKRWMHRYCAGIPVSYFQSYGASESPFYCYTCCYRNHASEIASLKETVNSLVTEVLVSDRESLKTIETVCRPLRMCHHLVKPQARPHGGR